MRNVAAIHQSAMEKADFGVAAKLRGDLNRSHLFFEEAFALEKEAGESGEGI